jgi:hypothetical protein
MNLLDDFALTDLLYCWSCDNHTKLLAWNVVSDRIAQCPVCRHAHPLEKLATDSRGG